VAVPELREALREGRLEPPEGKNRFTVYGRGELLLREGPEGIGRVPLGGLEILMDSGAFFQANAVLLEALIPGIRAAAEQADPSLPMAEVYAGVGTFSAFLGEKFPRIDLVEANKAALCLARENVPGKENRFFAMTEDRWVGGLRRRKERYGFMALDPPRQGLSPALRTWLREAGPPVLAYVSCNPATLARDSAALSSGGYRIASLDYYDFYPQTAHVESLAVFSRDAHGTA
jgi:23S rRNA (uracil1939-C5)-methyltransferase